MRIESTIEASCPPEALFTLLTTPERIPEWARSIVEAGRRTAGELAVASAFWNRVRFPSRQSWRLQTTSSGTHLLHLVEGEPGRFFGIFTPLLKLLGARQVRANLVMLKRLAETDSPG